VKNPHDIIIQPHITEKAVALSYGDERGAMLRKKHELDAKQGKKKGKAEKLTVDEDQIIRKYTFIVATDANKIEIKAAVEAIYNEGKKADQAISVTSVRTIKVPGKMRRRGTRTGGHAPDRKKAVVTLAKGQILEDYGV
jgi:large subunit ribosomal protein L23